MNNFYLFIFYYNISTLNLWIIDFVPLRNYCVVIKLTIDNNYCIYNNHNNLLIISN